jgi:hypothetical protein
MKLFILAAMIAVCFPLNALAQPHPVSESVKTAVKAPPAPEVVDVQYTGGMYGFSKKIDGTIKFDDGNDRLVFRGKDQKEVFGIPYESLLVIFPSEQSVTSTAGNVIKNIPVPGAGLGALMKDKRRYMVIQFDDPNIDAKGTCNFRIETKVMLDSVVQTLADKAKLKQRGDAFYRPKVVKEQ